MKKIGIVIVLAATLFVVPALGLIDDNLVSAGLYQSDGTSLRFPQVNNVNFDSITSGNDNALAFGPEWGFKSSIPPKATNNLEITKAQKAGTSGTSSIDPNYGFQINNSTTINIEQIKLGNRQALAFGSAVATNNIKITVAQEGSE